jgi:hypothetical protein
MPGNCEPCPGKTYAFIPEVSVGLAEKDLSVMPGMYYAGRVRNLSSIKKMLI